MAGYNADGTILLHPGGYWYLLEFHKKDTIADYTNRKGSCTGYYLVDGNMLSNPVDRFAEMDFTLDGAMQYDNGDDEPDIPGDGGVVAEALPCPVLRPLRSRRTGLPSGTGCA